MKLIRFITGIVCVCILASGLTSCEKREETTDKKEQSYEMGTETNKEENIDKEETSTEQEVLRLDEKIFVSTLAKENFLEPLDNFSWEREEPVERIVVHFTSAVVISRDDPYNMEIIRSIFKDNNISINYIIDRNGNVECYIPEYRCAWHAGVGTFDDDEKYTNSMNKYSIGIELVAMGSQNDMKQYLTPNEYAQLDKSLVGFSDAQYTALSALVSDICSRYNIPCDREHIIGHDEYNPYKSDPGELFDWSKIIK